MVSIQTGRSLVLTVIVILFSVGNLAAASTMLHVRATLLPYANMDVQQQATSYSITPADLERSYIDLPLFATVNIDTNVSTLILSIIPAGKEQILTSIRGTGSFSSTVEIVLTASERYASHATRNLDFRVLLDADIQTGTYVLNPWLSVQGY